MTRISIIGNAGGGKSTLARKLSRALGIELFPMDRLQWKPGWVHAPAAEIKQRHTEILSLDHWIIDGWGDQELIMARFSASDTIILVDHPLYVHYWWAAKRQIRCVVEPRIDGPEGCPMLPMTWPLLKMIWAIHFHARPKLLQLVSQYQAQKQIFHLHSPRELQQFELEYCS